MMSSAQLRAARAFLSWTMQEAADAAGIAKRTVLRLEHSEAYVSATTPSFQRLVSAYRNQGLSFDRGGLVMSNHANDAEA